MAAADALAIIAPGLASLDPVATAGALSLAEAWRFQVACLPDAIQDQAIAFLAASILSTANSTSESNGNTAAGTTTTTAGTPGGALIMEKEGDQEKRWASPTAAGSSTSSRTGTTSATALQQGNYRAQFDALAKLCGGGAIMTRFG